MVSLTLAAARLKKNLEFRPVHVAVSVFNFGTVEQKKAHALRLRDAGVRFLHLDATPEEKYTPEEIKQFDALEMPIQYHPMFPVDQAHFEALGNLRNLVTVFFHPTLTTDPQSLAHYLIGHGLDPYAVIAHDTPEQLWNDPSSYLYNPDLIKGILFMTVMYGKSERGFESDWLSNLRKVRASMHPAQRLWCDGAISDKTIPLDCGIDGVVSASYLLKASDPLVAVERLTNYDVAVGSDHAGLALKSQIIEHLKQQGKRVRDIGLYYKEFVEADAEYTDYPHYAHAVANEVSDREGVHLKHAQYGIVVCGSGQGSAMAANKVPRIRAALCRTEWDAEMARKHNDANVLTLGERCTSVEDAYKIVDVFLKTEFEGGRHQRRVEKIE